MGLESRTDESNSGHWLADGMRERLYMTYKFGTLNGKDSLRWVGCYPAGAEGGVRLSIPPHGSERDHYGGAESVSRIIQHEVNMRST
jgi:hypothetical protein